MKDSTTTASTADTAVPASEVSKSGNSGGSGGGSHVLVGRVMQITVFFVGFSVLLVFLYNSATSFGLPVISHYFSAASLKGNNVTEVELKHVLRSASMEHNTVIITTLNDAWAEPGSIFDLFLESFRIGNSTEKLLKHLVVITWDAKAYSCCLALHPHCYLLKTKGDNFTDEAFFMSQTYLHMMWRRIEFLGSVLEMGYSFVFTDTDIMWLRDPFMQFYKDADFQIACDYFNGNSYDLNNLPNGGFNYVKSNNKTIQFYKFWFDSRKDFPSLHDQDVLNKIKNNPFISKLGLQIRFLSTSRFGGFCQASKDLNQVCTMHANCCVGLENKVNDLKILLDDWRKYVALPANEKPHSHSSWSVPQSCRTSFQRSTRQKSKGRL